VRRRVSVSACLSALHRQQFHRAKHRRRSPPSCSKYCLGSEARVSCAPCYDYLHHGAVAQLGERRVRNAKVGSSSLLRSTKIFCGNSALRLATQCAVFILRWCTPSDIVCRHDIGYLGIFAGTWLKSAASAGRSTFSLYTLCWMCRPRRSRRGLHALSR
jgi:hypothetical protein